MQRFNTETSETSGGFAKMEKIISVFGNEKDSNIEKCNQWQEVLNEWDPLMKEPYFVNLRNKYIDPLAAFQMI